MACSYDDVAGEVKVDMPGEHGAPLRAGGEPAEAKKDVEQNLDQAPDTVLKPALEEQQEPQQAEPQQDSKRTDVAAPPVALPPASFFFARICAVAMGASIFCMLPLLIPLEAPDVGYFRGYEFFFGYNSFVGLTYTLATWARTRTMYVNADGSPFATDPFQKGIFLRKALPFLILVGPIGIYLVFMVCVAPWGDQVARSYAVIYGAPTWNNVADWSSFFWIKRDLKSGEIDKKKLFGLVNDVGGLTGVPMFLTFGAATAASFLNHPIANILCPGFNTLIIGGFVAAGKKRVRSGLQAVHLGVYFGETGIACTLYAILNFSKLVMLPYSVMVGSMLVTAIGLICADLADSAIYITIVTRARRRAKASQSDVDETAGVTMVGKAVNARLQGLAPAVRARLREPLCVRADQYIVFMVCPVMYMVVASLINFRGNRHFYHLYECVDDSILFETFTLVGVRCLGQVVIAFVELAFLHKCGILKEALLMVEVALKWRLPGTTFVIAFVGLVFTSCFYVKHDGIALFEFFCRG